ncbi:hypothetical protein [Niveibacterium terrae]|uniref:hypothetical protein n=1 Tax=Niveibacterium terrae TaxID=3373598 RepID=UPI003A92F57E
MKTILFALLFALNAGLACAEQACAQLNQDITAYQKAQASTPGQIIRYSDKEGALARAVLNPTRVQSAIDELAQGSATESGARLKNLAGRYTEVARNYVVAFQKHPEQYEEEYLDSFDSIFRLTLSSLIPLQKISIDEVEDPNLKANLNAMLKSTAQLVQSVGPLMLSAIEQQLREKRFSAGFTPRVTARLAQLREQLPRADPH